MTARAFPSEQSETMDGCWNQTFDPGMDLRDWFAGQVLPSIVNRPLSHGVSTVMPGSPMHAEKAAQAAYRYANAMMTARSEVTP